MKKIGFVLACMPMLLQAQTSVWKIEKNGKTNYIGGTVHILSEKDYPLPAAYEKAYEASSQLIFETDPIVMQNPTYQSMLMEKMNYDGDTTIQELISDSLYAELDRKCEAIGIPLAFFSKLRVSLLTSTMTLFQLKKNGIEGQGIDLYFAQKALQDNKKSLGLETPEFQFQKILYLGQGDEENYIRYALAELEVMDVSWNDLIKNWRNGDLKAMNVLLEEMKKTAPSTYNSLVLERNKNWLKQFDDLFTNQEGNFVLVGDLHLPGEEGIIQQLINKGYRLSQMP